MTAVIHVKASSGLADAAMQGARDLLAAPRDPEANNNYGAFDQGLVALVRAQLHIGSAK